MVKKYKVVTCSKNLSVSYMFKRNNSNNNTVINYNVLPFFEDLIFPFLEVPETKEK